MLASPQSTSNEILVQKYKTARFYYKAHYLLCCTIIGVAMIVGSGKKHIPVRLDTTNFTESNALRKCHKTYVNVLSTEKDLNSIICCKGDSKNITHLSSFIYEYEDLLCSRKTIQLPFAKSAIKFPDSWILCIIPIVFRILIATFEYFTSLCSSKQSYQRIISVSMKRMALYIMVMQYRGWVLYVFLNYVEDWMTDNRRSWSGMINYFDDRQDSCWYSEYVNRNGRDTEVCRGQRFDFSDHVVFFYAHMLPLLLFEVVYNLFVPIWPQMESSNDDGVKNHVAKSHQYICNAIKTGMGLYSCYLHVIILFEVYFTAAYFHTTAEVVVGLILSLSVQGPLSMLMCSFKWRGARGFLGLPCTLQMSMIDQRQHTD